VKRSLTDREYVGAAILVFIQCFHNHRRATGLREVIVTHVHDSEGRSRFDALPGHQPIARLENVQGHSLPGEENQAEREKRDARGAHYRQDTFVTAD
jgi:hypothetical protein